MHGFINLNKPDGITSNKAVVIVRKLLNIKKIGHSGTLDPGATGVLVLGVNQGTRLLQYLLDSDKKYRAELTFGIKTDTGDRFGNTVEVDPFVNFEKTDVINTFKNFVGDIKQVPPMTSAIKINGKKLYKIAHQGEEVERPPRKIIIREIKLINFEKKDKQIKIIFDVACSKGTYIRTLCEDIALNLNTVGYMSSLVRTEVGKFKLEESFTLEEIKEKISCNSFGFLKPLEYLVDDLPFLKYYVKEKDLDEALNGVSLTNEDNITGKLALYSQNGIFFGFATAEKEAIKINKIFKMWGEKC